MTKLIQTHSKTEQADSIAAYLPSGRLFAAARIEGTNLRKLLNGLAPELITAEGFFKTIADEYDLITTTLFINEWEAALGIPDDCFPGTDDIATRRIHVRTKLASLGVQTIVDFQDLATIFGINVVVRTALPTVTFPLTFPIPMYSSISDVRFTLIVDSTDPLEATFPLTFPITFGSGAVGVYQCLLNKLKPANVIVIFNQV